MVTSHVEVIEVMSSLWHVNFFFLFLWYFPVCCFQIVDLNQLAGNDDKGSSLRFGNMAPSCISFAFGFSKNQSQSKSKQMLICFTQRLSS